MSRFWEVEFLIVRPLPRIPHGVKLGYTVRAATAEAATRKLGVILDLKPDGDFLRVYKVTPSVRKWESKAPRPLTWP